MSKPIRNTTLYLRNVPEDVVRRLKAQAAAHGMTLTALATEVLSKAAGRDGRAALQPLEADVAWYRSHKRRLLGRYRGQHLAIMDGRLIDHDRDFDALARRVFGKATAQPIFMPFCTDREPVFHLRSPRLIRD